MNPLATVISMASMGGAVGATASAVAAFRAGNPLWGLYLLGLAIALALFAQRMFRGVEGGRSK